MSISGHQRSQHSFGCLHVPLGGTFRTVYETTGQDMDDGSIATPLIYSFKEGDIGQHANANRGSASVNFATGDSVTDCQDRTSFASLHGALMLIAWMLLAPVGIYFIR